MLTRLSSNGRHARFLLASALALGVMAPAVAGNQAGLEQLLVKKGVISQADLNRLKEGLTLEQLLVEKGVISPEEAGELQNSQHKNGLPASQSSESVDGGTAAKIDTEALADVFDEEFPVKAEHGGKGFRLKTRDGNWETNLQWRAQMRYSTPYRSDPRQVDDFESDGENTFELRRVRMKIGGHGYRPWLKYYFEVDLQPTRKADGEPEDASTRLIDWRLTLDKYKWLSLRLGQWKINYNRERVDSSGRQTFVERSIVNRVFTLDRQMGAMVFGRLFPETHADMRYFLGVFNGEGRGVKNDDQNMMTMGRLQWNFLGRDLKWRQSDVEFHEEPAASLAVAAATNRGRCTRWSSSGCGNLDGFATVSEAEKGQFDIRQTMQEFAFKWRGLAIQQELHWKTIEDRKNNTNSDLFGGYAQAGYFFHYLLPSVPENLEFAFRYAFVEEPNEMDIAFTNTRKEYTGAINYFIKGHNNKLTLDFSRLTLEDTLLDRDIADNRFRMQWDISF